MLKAKQARLVQLLISKLEGQSESLQVSIAVGYIEHDKADHAGKLLEKLYAKFVANQLSLEDFEDISRDIRAIHDSSVALYELAVHNRKEAPDG